MAYANGENAYHFDGKEEEETLADLGRPAPPPLSETKNPGFKPMVTVPLRSESHGGEDVAIYATGKNFK